MNKQNTYRHLSCEHANNGYCMFN